MEDAPQDFQANMLSYLDGIEIAKLRSISILAKRNIDGVEVQLYEIRMRVEYKKQYRAYKVECPFRIDWKNIYIITDQYLVAQKRKVEYRQIITNREHFLVFEKFSIMIEQIFGILTVAVNALKVGVLGFSASRALIRDFIKQNPQLTTTEALRELGIISKLPPPYPPSDFF